MEEAEPETVLALVKNACYISAYSYNDEGYVQNVKVGSFYKHNHITSSHEQ